MDVGTLLCRSLLLALLVFSVTKEARGKCLGLQHFVVSPRQHFLSFICACFFFFFQNTTKGCSNMAQVFRKPRRHECFSVFLCRDIGHIHISLRESAFFVGGDGVTRACNRSTARGLDIATQYLFTILQSSC